MHMYQLWVLYIYCKSISISFEKVIHQMNLMGHIVLKEAFHSIMVSEISQNVYAW